MRSVAAGERVFAIAVAALEVGSLREAVLAARKDADQDVALAAWQRSLEEKKADRGQAISKLMEMGKGSGLRAMLAKMALARAGAREVLPQDARSKVDQERKVAGTGLATLGELGQAAVLAVDENPQVRTGVACAMLRR